MRKFQIIDLVRSFSILAVLADHGSNFIKPLSNPTAQWFVHLCEKNGPKGVYFFFVVSGFLISKIIDEKGGLLRPDFKEFYVRRAARILPLLLLVLAIGIPCMEFLPRDSARVQFIFGSQDPLPHYWLWLSVLFFCMNWLHLLVYPSFFSGNYWQVLWTLSVEEQFYLFYPLVLKKAGTPPRLLAFLVFLLACGAAWRGYAFHYRPGWGTFGRSANSLAVFDTIALGILLYLAWKRYGKFLSRNRGLSRGLCLAGLLLALAFYFSPDPETALQQAFFQTFLGLGVALFLLGGLFLPFFEERWLWTLGLPGRYCYGMYLWHFLVLFFIGSLLVPLNGFLAFTLFCLATLAVAAASYHFFEVPANRWVRGFLGKRA